MWIRPMYSFNKHVLRTCSLPGTLLGTPSLLSKSSWPRMSYKPVVKLTLNLFVLCFSAWKKNNNCIVFQRGLQVEVAEKFGASNWLISDASSTPRSHSSRSAFPCFSGSLAKLFIFHSLPLPSLPSPVSPPSSLYYKTSRKTFTPLSPPRSSSTAA